MKTYVKVRKDNSAIIKSKVTDNISRTFTKDAVWLELVTDDAPVDYDKDTEKLVRSFVVPDLSGDDLENAIVRHVLVKKDLSAQERLIFLNEKLTEKLLSGVEITTEERTLRGDLLAAV